jgi:transposase
LTYFYGMKNGLENLSKKELIEQLLAIEKSNRTLTEVVQNLTVTSRDKDQIISLKQKSIFEQKKAIAESEKVIAQKEKVIAQKEIVIAKKEKVIAKSEKVIAKSEKVIAKKEEVIAEKEEVIAEKEEVIAEKEEVIAEKETEVARLNLIVANLKRMLFGSKRERFVAKDNAQLTLAFEEFASQEVQNDTTPVKEKITYEREKPSKHAGRNKLPDNLPVVEEIIEPEDLTEDMVKMGEEITEILEYTPARFFKRRIIRPKYVNKKTQEIKIAELPSRPIEKCLAGNSVLTHILVSKYVDHLPLYRQQQIFKRVDIEIAPSTIDSWMALSGNLLVPLYHRMVEIVKRQRYLQADETTLKVLDNDKKGQTHLGYLWAYHAVESKLCVFDYQKGRGAEAPRQMLADYRGALQTDGYSVYQQFCLNKEVTHLACWAHVRRYFEKALAQDQKRASYVLQEIQKLYAIERKTADLTAPERKEIRLDEALPIINSLGQWLHRERNMVLPKSLIGKAIEYCTKLWASLMAYLENGAYQIDNNAIENKIRPVALGRKNYLFAGSHAAAEKTAMFYTFFANCKLNNVNPEKWLNTVLDIIADYPCNKLQELFPGKLEV